MSNFSFAISNSCNIPPVKTIAKQVKTKAWVKRYSDKLGKHSDRLTNSGANSRHVLGGMLQAAYGVNIGEQVLSQLDDNHLETIKQNIIGAL